MSRDLHGEISAFLATHGPSTAAQIATGVRARRAGVDEALLSGAFVEAPTPGGGSPRARHWVDAADQSQAVLPRPKGQGRGAAMLSVLADGREHSRADIFKATGKFFLTNNAAAELRAKGYDIRSREVKRGLYVYWLVPAQAKTAALRVRPAKARSAFAEAA